jgi:hypothetical protein
MNKGQKEEEQLGSAGIIQTSGDDTFGSKVALQGQRPTFNRGWRKNIARLTNGDIV